MAFKKPHVPVMVSGTVIKGNEQPTMKTCLSLVTSQIIIMVVRIGFIACERFWWLMYSQCAYDFFDFDQFHACEGASFFQSCKKSVPGTSLSPCTIDLMTITTRHVLPKGATKPRRRTETTTRRWILLFSLMIKIIAANVWTAWKEIESLSWSSLEGGNKDDKVASPLPPFSAHALLPNRL